MNSPVPAVTSSSDPSAPANSPARATVERSRGDLFAEAGRRNGTDVETAAVGLVVRGRLAELHDAVRSLPPERRTPVLRVLASDAAMRLGTADFLELEALEQEAHTLLACGGPDLRSWMRSVMAEHLFWHADYAVAIDFATEALRDVPARALVPTTTLVARGRLKCIAALGRLGADVHPDTKHPDLDDGLEDLRRAGWEEQRWVAEAMYLDYRAQMTWDGVEQVVGLVEGYVERLLGIGSLSTPHVQSLLAHLRLLNGDFQGLYETIAATYSSGLALPPIVEVTNSVTRAVATMLERGADPESVATLDAAVIEHSSRFIRGTGTVRTHVASLLVDLGNLPVARAWLERAGEHSASTCVEELERQAAAVRLRIRAGDRVDAVRDFENVVAELRGRGLARRAAMTALRGAHDCDRMQLPTVAERWRSEAVADLPPPEGRSLWETLLVVPCPRAARSPGHAAGSPRWLRLLVPDVELGGGDAADTANAGKVHAAQARLLAVLALEAKAVTIDRLADLLWPETDIASGRNRLNVTIHRIRKTLGLAVDELVVRGDDKVGLDPGEGWKIDVWEFWSLTNGGAAECRRGLELYEGHLLSRQLAYDDSILLDRDRLQARWIDTAVQLLVGGEVDPLYVSERVRALAIDDPSLIEPLAEALHEAGRSCEADLLQATT